MGPKGAEETRKKGGEWVEAEVPASIIIQCEPYAGRDEAPDDIRPDDPVRQPHEPSQEWQEEDGEDQTHGEEVPHHGRDGALDRSAPLEMRIQIPFFLLARLPVTLAMGSSRCQQGP